MRAFTRWEDTHMAHQTSNAQTQSLLDTGAQRLFRLTRLAAVAGAASLLLAACGGGGDSGSTSSAASTPATTNATVTSAATGESGRSGKTGFIPAAPTAGETLYADASVLRPLRDEALWAYQGVKISGASKTTYSSFRQVIASGGAFEERISSPIDKVSRVQKLQLSAGSVQSNHDLGLTAASAPASVVELRSPVRRDEQTVLVDVTGAALKDDLDKDNKTDLVDIGTYSRVIGDEDVSLPELGRTVRALRVDVTTTTRVTLSSRGQADAAQTVVESTWYAAGIGIVRRTTTEAAATGVGAIETDERLQFWDGVDKGVGLVPSAPVSVSGGASSIGPWLELPFAAVRNGQRAFMLSSRGGVPVRADRGVVLSVLDTRGRVIHSAAHTDLGFSATARPEIMAVGDGVAMIFAEAGVYADPYQLENLRMTRFDAQGNRTSSHWLTAGALPGSMKAASDGDTVWVTWVEQGPTAGSTRVMVQAFDGRGNERTAPQLLDTRSGAEPATVGISAAEGRALVTWRAPMASGQEFRQALVRADAKPAIATLDVGAMSLGSTGAQPMPRLSASLAAITWYQPLQPTTAGTAALPRGVSLDALAVARRAVIGGVDNETLALPAHDAGSTSYGIDGARLLWSAVGTSRVRSDDLVDDRYLDFASLEPGNSALATSAVQLKRYRDRSPASDYSNNLSGVRHVLSFDDRYLVIGQDSTRMTLAVLHK